MSDAAQNSGNQPLRIGPIVLAGRAFLAPMSGITDIGMRRVARRFGASLVVSEMVASDDYVRGGQESRSPVCIDKDWWARECSSLWRAISPHLPT